MAGSDKGSTFKSIIIPVVVALSLYLSLTYLFIPLYRRYRSDITRYSQYAPLSSTLQHTTSIFSEYVPNAFQPRTVRQRLGNWLMRLVLPSTWTFTHTNRSGGERPESVTSEDGGLFDAETGEAMIGFDVGHNRGRGARGSSDNHAMDAALQTSDRRLSRELEEGFADDSGSEDSDQEVTAGRRRASMSANR